MTVGADRIVVTEGTAEALKLLASFFVDEGYDRFYAENPSIPYARQIARAAGLEVRELQQDEVSALPPEEPEPGSVYYLTPSHQFPRGMCMPLPRRLEFINGLDDTISYILEDDYDSEFRFRGVPTEPLVALDPDRVIYMGSFSKVLFPALRLGFVVLPEQLLAPFLEHKRCLFAVPPTFCQGGLARFLSRGYLEKHLFEMKRTYARRAARIVEFLEAEFPDIEIRGTECGYHLWVRFTPQGGGSGSVGAIGTAAKANVGGQARMRSDHPFDRNFFEKCADQGLAIKGEGHYSFDGSPETDALVLGYGNVAEEELEEALSLLARMISPGGRR